MRKQILNWLDSRTGYRAVLSHSGSRFLPDGPKWVNTTAPCVLWVFVLELVTGLFLLTSYSPSHTNAWASVYYIEQLPGGSFLRGLHYYGGHALIILFAIHAMRVLLAASYRTPRELVWISGLVILPLVIVWGVTGNPLNGSQKGYAQIEVEGNILASTPVVGPIAREILIGGDQVGNLTLTHLNFLHVAFLPLLVVVLTFFHLRQVARHAPRMNENEGDSTPVLRYWPHQSIRNAIVFSAVLAVISYLAVKYGAPLEVPADPSLHHSPRPEWYFLFLFELRRYFTGDTEFIATIVLPSIAMLLLLCLPLIDLVTSKRTSAITRYLIVFGGVAMWTGLTMASYMRDRDDEEYQAAMSHEHDLAVRARALATQGIPPEGAIALLRNDPKTQGPLLFAQHCAACHSHTDTDGNGIAAKEQSAPNLYGFGSRKWVADLLNPEKWESEHFFGNTAFSGSDMTSGVTDFMDEDDVPSLVAALSAEAQLTSQANVDKNDTDEIAAGREFIMDDSDGCASCHKFHDVGILGDAPDLTDYASREWLIRFISNPENEHFYPDTNDRMPAFAENSENPEKNLLTTREVELIADWIRQDWFEPK